ncbi:hypothetical protein LSM04_001435 [Trypanosoma melophagium]|uniref:uncharacterized protein n=1 Tax=Trypanosoma melophagium TaxID=715481 RepID=UPI003519F343|nr:hypothetical protein LSM04_001435 [Trypanosoma melophagium]
MTQRTSLRKTTEEWQDAFYSVDERNRQLQKKLNEQEQELKLLRVAQRRNGTHSLLAKNNSAIRAAPQSMKPKALKRSTSTVSASRPTEKPSPQEPLSLNTTRNNNVYNVYDK